MSEARLNRGVLAAGVALFVVAAFMRINNALRFPAGWGFDGGANWRYIARLRDSFELPAPDAFWSAYHPPLFYLMSGALARVLEPLGKLPTVAGIRILSSAIGLIAIGFGIDLLRRVDPLDTRRWLLAAALMLFLPVHIYMSAMLSPELLVASLTTLVVAGVAAEQAGNSPRSASILHAVLLGVLGGLAFLTKLTGCLVVVVAAASILLRGWHRRELKHALLRATIVSGVALLVGGWFYARNLIGYGYLYPHSLDVHEIMFTMPPGSRTLVDYFYVPLASWTDPQVLSPDLLRSVWGSTYVSMWFDGHRHFLARSGDALAASGTLILTLALLPMAAFAVGVARGVRRAFRRIGGPDTPLLLLLAITLAGFVAFTWKNPWFVTLKASFLLGLLLPFAYYASEVLADWTRRSGPISLALWAALAALLLCVLLVFSYGLVFSNPGPPGIVWERVPAS